VLDLERAIGVRAGKLASGNSVYSYMYFAKADDGSVKIGISGRPQNRTQALGYRFNVRHVLLLIVARCTFQHERSVHSLLQHEVASLSREHFLGEDTGMVLAKLLREERSPVTVDGYAAHLSRCIARGISDAEIRRLG